MLIYLLLPFSLFIIGTFGLFIARKHIILILISIELLLLACMIFFVISSILLDDILGQIYALLILSVGAAESALGLALLIVFYRLRGGIFINLITLLKS